MMPQVFLVGMFERRTSQDNVLASVASIVDQFGESLEPGLSVLIGQRNPLVHLLDVRGGVVVVGVIELPAELARQKFSHGRLSGARDTHQNDDHSPCLPRSPGH